MMMVAKNVVSLLAVLMITTPCVLLTSATTTTTTTDCSAAYDACFADDNCLECITLSMTSSSQTECEESYQGDSSTTTQCGYEAIAYCCQSETSATAQCVQDDITIAYWTCILEETGCSIDDMPCLTLETPAPITTASPTTIEDEDEDDDADDDASETNWAVGAAKPSGTMYAFGLGAMAAIVGIMM